MASKRYERQVKSDTIQSYIANHRFKLPEVKGLLSFLINKNKYLDCIEIVDNLEDKEHSMLISAICTDGDPFVFKIGDKTYTRPSQATVELLKLIELKKLPEKIYIKFHTESGKITEEKQKFINLMTKWKEDLFQDEVNLIAEKHFLMEKIDQALVDGNEILFNSLSEKLKQLNRW